MILIGAVYFLFVALTSHAHTQPINGWSSKEKMDIQRLKEVAFQRCQSEFEPPKTPSIPLLDPPQDSKSKSIGLVFQEELAITTQDLLLQHDFYISPRPRAALNTAPMDVFVSPQNNGEYFHKTWYDAKPNYASEIIHPPIHLDDIPDEGRVLTELIFGHRSPQGDYPQLFDIRSSAYVRFAGYAPQIPGASLRLGVHDISASVLLPGLNEDFPILRAAFTSISSTEAAHALILIENRAFCGALKIDMLNLKNATMDIDGYWYTREDFKWQEHPYSGFVAYSSMMWRNETSTSFLSIDEAHDSDTLNVYYPSGQKVRHVINTPSEGVDVTEYEAPSGNLAWELANEDRSPFSYAYFQSTLGATNFQHRVSYRVEVLYSNIRTAVLLFEGATDIEYADNIVAAQTIRQDIAKPKTANEAIRFKYRTSAYYPPWP